ncbi:MAG: hypothetical protein RR100_06415 [Comamonas sp.]
MRKKRWGALALVAMASCAWAAVEEPRAEAPAAANTTQAAAEEPAETSGDALEIGAGPGSASAPAEPASPTEALAQGAMCFFAGAPPETFKYTVIRKFKVAKGSYGGVKDILPQFAAHANKLGADAVIKYAGSQRFGFWPWRMVRPVAQGVAVKWQTPPTEDCQTLGGRTLATILATDQAPPRQP